MRLNEKGKTTVELWSSTYYLVRLRCQERLRHAAQMRRRGQIKSVEGLPRFLRTLTMIFF